MKKNTGFDITSASEYVENMSTNAINDTIRIAGTDYDRRRKVTRMQQRIMKNMVKHNVPQVSIARFFGVSPTCVKYNTDTKFRKYSNSCRTKYKNYNNSHFQGEGAARAQYKLDLIRAGKMI